MRTPVLFTKFKRDIKRIEKRGKDVNKLKVVLANYGDQLQLARTGTHADLFNQ